MSKHPKKRKRTIRRRPAPPPLQRTDRMRDQGVQATCWWTADHCPACGGPMATDGTLTWCGTGEHPA